MFRASSAAAPWWTCFHEPAQPFVLSFSFLGSINFLSVILMPRGCGVSWRAPQVNKSSWEEKGLRGGRLDSLRSPLRVGCVRPLSQEPWSLARGGGESVGGTGASQGQVRDGGQAAWVKSRSAASQLCDFGQIAQPLCASVFLSVE